MDQKKQNPTQTSIWKKNKKKHKTQSTPKVEKKKKK